MKRTVLAVASGLHDSLWAHLLPARRGPEQAAFAYVEPDGDRKGARLFRCLEWQSVPPRGFESRSAFHLELTAEMQGEVIKRAHDIGASLVELHSHVGRWPAAFSESDLLGLREFVPHVQWRLKGKPYFAVVVAQSGFDGFVWTTGSEVPDPLNGILVGNEFHACTGLSRWDADDVA